jgi:hypothetical protein
MTNLNKAIRPPFYGQVYTTKAIRNSENQYTLQIGSRLCVIFRDDLKTLTFKHGLSLVGGFYTSCYCQGSHRLPTLKNTITLIEKD